MLQYLLSIDMSILKREWNSKPLSKKQMYLKQLYLGNPNWRFTSNLLYEGLDKFLSINKNKLWEIENFNEKKIITCRRGRYFPKSYFTKDGKRYVPKPKITSTKEWGIVHKKIEYNEIIINEDWVPSKSFVKEHLSVSGSRCLHWTKDQRSKKRRQRKNILQDEIKSHKDFSL